MRYIIGTIIIFIGAAFVFVNVREIELLRGTEQNAINGLIGCAIAILGVILTMYPEDLRILLSRFVILEDKP